jgi:stage IV sporulation protein FB
MEGRVSTIEGIHGDQTVFLFEPQRTQFDLNFRIFGIQVRVHPLFWLVTAILGPRPQDGVSKIALWIVVVFVSILIHEMGHVLMGKIFGSHGHIVLYGFGGLAVGSSNLSRRWQRNLVYFAGPLAQFFILGVVLAAGLVCLAYRIRPSDPAEILLDQLFQVNLFWPLLNLLPIWPLDGGRISRETFEWLMPERGTETSLILSMIVAGLLAIYSLAAAQKYFIIPFLPGDMFLAFFFALFAVNNFQEWQAVRYQSRHPWENEEDRW